MISLRDWFKLSPDCSDLMHLVLGPLLCDDVWYDNTSYLKDKVWYPVMGANVKQGLFLGEDVA